MKDENIENSTRELTYKNSEHPLTAYSIAEIYSIRKESINSATDQIYKKLGKKFQRIKKLRS